MSLDFHCYYLLRVYFDFLYSSETMSGRRSSSRLKSIKDTPEKRKAIEAPTPSQIEELSSEEETVTHRAKKAKVSEVVPEKTPEPSKQKKKSSESKWILQKREKTQSKSGAEASSLLLEDPSRRIRTHVGKHPPKTHSHSSSTKAPPTVEEEEEQEEVEQEEEGGDEEEEEPLVEEEEELEKSTSVEEPEESESEEVEEEQEEEDESDTAGVEPEDEHIAEIEKEVTPEPTPEPRRQPTPEVELDIEPETRTPITPPPLKKKVPKPTSKKPEPKKSVSKRPEVEKPVPEKPAPKKSAPKPPPKSDKVGKQTPAATSSKPAPPPTRRLTAKEKGKAKVPEGQTRNYQSQAFPPLQEGGNEIVIPAEKMANLVTKDIPACRAIHDPSLQRLNLKEEVHRYLKNIGWLRYKDIKQYAYRQLVHELYSSFYFDKHTASTNVHAKNTVCFNLIGNSYKMSLADFNVCMGFMTTEEVNDPEFESYLCEIPADFNDVSVYDELTIPGAPVYNTKSAKDHWLISPALRYVHRFLSHSFSCRPRAASIVNKLELFVLWCMREGLKVNLGY